MNRRKLIEFLSASALLSQVPVKPSAASDTRGGEPYPIFRTIRIVGIGACGIRMLNLMIERDIRFQARSQSYVAIGGNKEELRRSSAEHKVWLQNAEPWQKGDDIVELDRKQSAAIRSAVRDTEDVLLVAELGDRYGMGASPMVTKFAKKAGAAVYAVAVLPSEFEWREEHFLERGPCPSCYCFQDSLEVIGQAELIKHLISTNGEIRVSDHFMPCGHVTDTQIQHDLLRFMV